MDMFKKACKCVCVSSIVVLPSVLSPTASPFSAMKTLENTQEDADDPEPADGGDSQMEYFFD